MYIYIRTHTIGWYDMMCDTYLHPLFGRFSKVKSAKTQSLPLLSTDSYPVDSVDKCQVLSLSLSDKVLSLSLSDK